MSCVFAFFVTVTITGVLQYVVIRIATTLVALYLQLGHMYYAEGDFDAHVRVRLTFEVYISYYNTIDIV